MSDADPMAVSPDLVIAKVSETPLGDALVGRAYMTLVAERLASENRRLRADGEKQAQATPTGVD